MSATETTVNNTTGEAPSQDAPSQVPAEVEAKSAEAEGFRVSSIRLRKEEEGTLTSQVYFGNLSYKVGQASIPEAWDARKEDAYCPRLPRKKSENSLPSPAERCECHVHLGVREKEMK
jgi:hypothetical protein